MFLQQLYLCALPIHYHRNDSLASHVHDRALFYLFQFARTLDRISKLVGGQLFKSPVLGKNQAVLLCAQPENVDLVVGQDIAAAYLEQRDLNHHFRLLESVLPRIRRQKAIVVFK